MVRLIILCPRHSDHTETKTLILLLFLKRFISNGLCKNRMWLENFQNEYIYLNENI